MTRFIFLAVGSSVCTVLGSDQFYGWDMIGLGSMSEGNWDMIGLGSMSEGPDAGPVKGIIQGTIPKSSLPSDSGSLQLCNRI